MLADLVQTVTVFLQNIVDVFGPMGIILVALGENIFPPTPSEFLYPLAGKMAYDGTISPVMVVIAGVVGSLIGSMIYYAVGYRLGRERIRDMITRHGTIRIGIAPLQLKFQWVAVEEYDRALDLFERHGGMIVFIARIMPLVHGVVSIPAGVIRMNLGAFLAYTALGAACWIAPLTLFGYWLGDNWERLLYWLDIYENVWYLLIAVAIGSYIAHRIRLGRNRVKAHSQAQTKAPSAEK